MTTPSSPPITVITIDETGLGATSAGEEPPKPLSKAGLEEIVLDGQTPE